MKENVSRTAHITRNTLVVVATNIISVAFAFISRTVFIRLLGRDYLGIDGLFSSILTIFSLAELGIGNALVFSLYKPVAEGDYNRARQYLTLYRKAYRWIIVVVLSVGLCILPFIKQIIKTDISSLGIDIYVVYLLFLFNSVSSYFAAHRQAVLMVNQKQSTIAVYQTIAKLAVYCLECCVLLIWHNYYLFLLIRIVGNYALAISISLKALRQYPTLCEPTEEKLPSSEISRIKKNVYSLFLRRLGSVVFKTVDNFVINSCISLAMVGVYSNYVMIIAAIQTVSIQGLNAVTASMGNFVATSSTESAEKAFRLYSYITYLIIGFCSICLIVLTNKFILLIWGETYLLSRAVLYLLVADFFFHSFQSVINVMRDTTGTFVQGKYRMFVSAIINVIASILLARIMGIEGVILGTILSRLLVSVWFDPFVLYKYFFRKSPLHYLSRLGVYFIAIMGVAAVVDFATSGLKQSWFTFVLCGVLSVFTIPILFFIFYRTMESRDFQSRIRKILNNKSSL